MRKDDTIAFNANFIRNRVKILGLKRLWLAEKIGVSEKTVSRWVNGKVCRMAHENAVALADCINVSIEEFEIEKSVPETLEDFSKEDFAEKVISENLLLLLSPTGNWELIESIIRSCIASGLSLKKTGRLLNLLSITNWRKQQYADAKKYALKAREIGERIDDKSIIVKSLYNTGTIESLTGFNDKALNDYLKCYKLKEHFELKTDFASVCINLSMVYRDMAEFAKSLELQNEAIELFETGKHYFNLSIAHQCLSFIYAETGNKNKALESIETAIQYAQKANHSSGLVIFPIYRLNALTSGKTLKKMPTDADQAIDSFLNCKFYDPFCFEFIGRYLRRAGKSGQAKKILKIGIDKAHDNPVAKAAILHEMARLALLLNQSDLEKMHRKAANQIYQQSGLPKRVFASTIQEYGTIYSLEA